LTFGKIYNVNIPPHLDRVFLAVRMKGDIILTEENRMKITNQEELNEFTSNRTEIEGINSALKRAHNAGELHVYFQLMTN